MKFKTNKKEKEIKLYLKKRGEKEIILKALDSKGRDWDLMFFEDGKFQRAPFILSDSGIEIDDLGRIIEIK